MSLDTISQPTSVVASNLQQTGEYDFPICATFDCDNRRSGRSITLSRAGDRYCKCISLPDSRKK